MSFVAAESRQNTVYIISGNALEGVGQTYQWHDIGAKSAVVDSNRGVSNKHEFVFESELPADRYGI
jgi:hypothetical protein